MDEHQPVFAARSHFGRRRVTPHALVADRKPHIRTFLGEALEELGFVAHQCAQLAELRPALNAAFPDLIVISLANDGLDGVTLVQALAGEGFSGNVLLIGGREQPTLTAVQRLGETLGLAMLPALGTPYRDADLRERVAELIPGAAPPEAPVDVAEALAAGWLDVWYQAKIDARSLLPAGAEALVRMRHPAWGVVPPARFIPDDHDPHFQALSDFVVGRAMADWTYFAGRYTPVKLAVNLPLAVLEDPHAVARLTAQLPRHPTFDGLTIEISGAEIAARLDLARTAARALRLHNIGIAIQAIGAEWPPLSMLADLPFVELKVDPSFVKGCADDPLKRAACRTILDAAARFGVVTVAAGVERRADFDAVQEMGFDLVQGFLFHKPTTARKFARAMLRARPVVPKS
jgi:EAL domain-containing protein (putative c-di-GMP-specific phosphodiesterase class I)